MKKMLVAAALVFSGLFDSAPAQAAQEYVHRFYVGGECTVIVTTIYETSNETSTRQYTCAEYEAIEEYFRQRNAQWAREAEEEKAQEAFEEERKVKISEIEQMGLYEHAKTLQLNDQWYPDKTRKALIGISEGKSVAELASFLTEYGPYKVHPYEMYTPFEQLSSTYLMSYLQQKGYGSARILSWSNRPFDFCGQKASIFVVELEHGDKILKTGIVWSFNMILGPQEINRTSANQADCLNYFD